MKLCFATNNPNKLKEIAALLPQGVELVGLADIGIDEDIPETGETLAENSALKAQYVFERKAIAVFADDTGLEVLALNGAPGVYSARYSGSQRDATDNMNLLLSNLAGKSDRSACFKTVITYIDFNGNVHAFEGRVDGQINHEKRGTGGFGYDPIFVPEGEWRTFAEMSGEEKNRISHRARAFEKLVDFLNSAVK